MPAFHTPQGDLGAKDEERYLSVEEVAKRLGVSTGILVRRVEAGDIPARRVASVDGARYELRLSDLGLDAEEADEAYGRPPPVPYLSVPPPARAWDDRGQPSGWDPPAPLEPPPPPPAHHPDAGQVPRSSFWSGPPSATIEPRPVASWSQGAGDAPPPARQLPTGVAPVDHGALERSLDADPLRPVLPSASERAAGQTPVSFLSRYGRSDSWSDSPAPGSVAEPPGAAAPPPAEPSWGDDWSSDGQAVPAPAPSFGPEPMPPPGFPPSPEPLPQLPSQPAGEWRSPDPADHLPDSPDQTALLAHPGNGLSGELALAPLDPRELVAGLLDRWERSLEKRIYAEQQQRFESDLANRQALVRELQMELQATRAEHAAALAAKDRVLADRDRALAELERQMVVLREAGGRRRGRLFRR